MAQGLIEFPGITRIQSGSFNYTRGVSPSRATLTIAPQGGLDAEVGTLIISFAGLGGASEGIHFRDCRIDENSYRRNRQGAIWQLSILDRRWKWTRRGGGGFISGRYNRRKPDGTLVASSEKKPQELATLLLDKMDEKDYDVADLPDDPRPLVDWDYDLPAEALAELCDLLGYSVILDYDNKVKIRQNGVGSVLPDGGVMEHSLTITLPAAPEHLRIVTAPIKFQGDFLLDAVGQDVDGSVQKINDLSYKPEGGWGHSDPPYETDVLTNHGKQAQGLAQRTVFRWYRIDAPFVVPFFGTVNTLDQVLPLLPHQVQTKLDNGVEKRWPPLVYGKWFEALDAKFGNTVLGTTPYDERETDDPDPQLYPYAYTIDVTRGIVKFSQAVFSNLMPSKKEVNRVEAIMRLRIAVNVRWRDDWSQARATFQWPVEDGLERTLDRVYLHEEFGIEYWPRYTADFTQAVEHSNFETVKVEARHYFDAAVREYKIEVPITAKYAGIWKIPLDGAIQHVQFSVGLKGATTRASHSTEMVDIVVPYKRRRVLEVASQEFVTPKERQRLRAMAGTATGDW